MRRVVITGIGIVSPVGTGKKQFWQALFSGKSGIRHSELIDTSGIKSKLAGEVADFDPVPLLGKKGLRLLDRATKFVLCAAKLALIDAGFEVDNPVGCRCGVSLGTAMGSVESRAGYHIDLFSEGPRGVNPAKFPNTVVNSPCAHIAIRFGITGFNATISAGQVSSLESVDYAAHSIKNGRVDFALAGGVEELTPFHFLSLYQAGVLSREVNGIPEGSRPYDLNRNGIVLGEGAALLILEELEHARRRGAHIYAEYRGRGSEFYYNPVPTGMVNAINEALDESQINPDDIDVVFTGANSSINIDRYEANAVEKVFGEKNIPAPAIKSMTGETGSAAGAFHVSAALGAIESGIIPPTLNIETVDEECPVDPVPNVAREKKCDAALITSSSYSGENAACILSGVC